MLKSLEAGKHYHTYRNYGLIYAVVGIHTPPPLYLKLVHEILSM